MLRMGLQIEGLLIVMTRFFIALLNTLGVPAKTSRQIPVHFGTHSVPYGTSEPTTARPQNVYRLFGQRHNTRVVPAPPRAVSISAMCL